MKYVCFCRSFKNNPRKAKFFFVRPSTVTVDSQTVCWTSFDAPAVGPSGKAQTIL